MMRKKTAKKQKLDSAVSAKADQVSTLVKEMGKVVLAFSGGVDSTFLLAIAREVLGENVIAVTAVSPLHPEEEYEDACARARSLGVRHISIATNELSDDTFCKNPPQRCYHCKKELFQALSRIARQVGASWVVDASNQDDLSDFRPGRIAAQEEGIRSPLVEAGMTKEDIRALSRKMGLPTWDKPSLACLASRFPYGEKITLEKINRVAAAEKFLRGLGARQVRVRIHDTLARIEVDAEHIERFVDRSVRRKIITKFKDLGFIYLAVDLEGYRTGSLNEALRR